MGPAKPIPLITPSAGGRWMAQSSEDTAGTLNYVEKVNFRRDGDVEARREGWKKFKPNESGDLQHVIAPGYPGKLTLLAECIRPNGERCIVAAKDTMIFRFFQNSGVWSSIGHGFTPGVRWQATNIDGYLCLNNGVDLPHVYRVEFPGDVQPIKELREVGIASAKWMVEYNGFLVLLNVSTMTTSFMNSIMNSGNPYRAITPAENADATKINHISYRVIWSEFGKPTNWAPAFTVTMNNADNAIDLPFPSSIFIPGVTRVAVINGGPDGGTLGGDETHPNGILVTGVSANRITLERTTDPAISYPRDVTVMRWEDQSTMSAYKDLQGDSSAITCAYVLHSMLIVYRYRGIYVGRYKADVAEPFDWSERVEETPNVPIWPEAVAIVGDDEYHLFPGRGNFFYAFDGVNPPQIHAVMDETRRKFFEGLNDTSNVWAVANPASKESWFVRPGFTVCYDHIQKTCSEMNCSIDAAAYVARPVPTPQTQIVEDWFILSVLDPDPEIVPENKLAFVYTYGRVNGQALTFLRDGANPGGRLVWGRGAFGDTFNEKMLRSYLLHFASTQLPFNMRVKLFSTHAAQAALTNLIDEVIPTEATMIPVDFKAVYFKDELHIADDQDREVRFVGRVFERGPTRSAGVTRNAVVSAVPNA